MREKLDNIKNIAQRCLKCKKPLCKEYCPLHNNIPVILNTRRVYKVQKLYIWKYAVNGVEVLKKLRLH